MSLANIDRRQLRLVCSYTLRHSLRSGSGLVFLLLALFLGLTVAHTIISPYELSVAQSRERGMAMPPALIEQQLVELARPAVAWVVAPRAVEDPEARRAAEARTDEWVSYLLDERPALLSAIFVILLFAMPLLIPFGAFNQTAGDIGNRGLRYVLLRTERANIFYGRMLATMGLTIAVLTFVVVTVALYVAIKVVVYDPLDVAIWSGLGLLALSVVSLPYVALCAWLSTRQESAITALIACKGLIVGVWLFALLGSLAWQPAAYLRYLLPWGIQDQLLGPSVATVAVASLACLAYAGVFTWLGGRNFERRDL
jgi:hypothetical protein